MLGWCPGTRRGCGRRRRPGTGPAVGAAQRRERQLDPDRVADHLVGFDQALGVERVVVGVLVGRGTNSSCSSTAKGCSNSFRQRAHCSAIVPRRVPETRMPSTRPSKRRSPSIGVVLAHARELGAEFVHGAFDVGLSGAARLAHEIAHVDRRQSRPSSSNNWVSRGGRPRVAELLLGGRRRRPELLATHLDLIEGLGERLGRRWESSRILRSAISNCASLAST